MDRQITHDTSTTGNKMLPFAQPLARAWEIDTEDDADHTSPSDDDATEALTKITRALANCSEHHITLRKFRMGRHSTARIVIMLESMPTVKKLDLYGNLLREKGCQIIGEHLEHHSTNLTHLNLGGNDIIPTNVGMASFFSSLEKSKTLKILDFGTEPGDPFPNRIDSNTTQTLVDAIAQPKHPLKWLNLSRNPIGKADQFGFVALAMYLSGSPNLQVLKLSKTGLDTDTAVELFAALHTNFVLQLLDISQNNLYPPVGGAIADLLEEKRNLKRKEKDALQALCLSNNPHFGRQGLIPCFRALAMDKSITSLDLSNTGLDDTALQSLSLSVLSNSTLTTLDISHNTFEDVSTFGPAMCHNHSVQYLNVNNNKIGDSGACVMASILQAGTPLHYLDVSHCGIQDKGAVAIGVGLSNNDKLVSLNLSHNLLTVSAGGALKELCKNTKALQHFDISGTMVFTGDELKITSSIRRNKQMKSEQVLAHMREEVIRLQYIQQQLHEAQRILRKFERQRYEIEKEWLQTERFYMKDKEATIRRIKEVRTTLQAELSLLDEFRFRSENKETEINNLQQKMEAEVKNLSQILQEDRDTREDQTNELSRLQQREQWLTVAREEKLKRSKETIVSAKKDRDDWLLKQREYKELISVIQKRATEIEHELEEKKRLQVQREQEAAERRRQRKAKITGLNRDTIMEELLQQAIAEEANAYEHRRSTTILTADNEVVTIFQSTRNSRNSSLISVTQPDSTTTSVVGDGRSSSESLLSSGFERPTIPTTTTTTATENTTFSPQSKPKLNLSNTVRNQRRSSDMEKQQNSTFQLLSDSPAARVGGGGAADNDNSKPKAHRISYTPSKSGSYVAASSEAGSPAVQQLIDFGNGSRTAFASTYPAASNNSPDEFRAKTILPKPPPKRPYRQVIGSPATVAESNAIAASRVARPPSIHRP